MSTVKDLTGGSDDLNPQHASLRLTQDSIDENIEGIIDLSGCSMSAPKGKAIVAELLAVTFNQSPVFSSLDQAEYGVSMSTETMIGKGSVVGVPRLANGNDGKVFIKRATNSQTVITAVGTMDRVDLDTTYNLTDNAGHGIIVPCRKVYCQLVTDLLQTAMHCDYQILFRYKYVDLIEFLTIINSGGGN